MVILRSREKTMDKEDWTLPEVLPASQQTEDFRIGFAVDIGTTTIAVYALDMQEGKLLGAMSEMNEQTKLGADVMMRIMHAVQGKEHQLHRILCRQIESIAGKIIDTVLEKELPEGKQVCFSVVGNTAMCHFFLGKDVSGLSGYPFCPAYQGNVTCMGKEVGMERFADSTVKVLTGIAAHVGSDTMAVIGAQRLYSQDKLQIAVDLGTNAEIVLNKRGEIFVCSAAAGPAFEGKGVSCGMAAKQGAITGMRILKNGNYILEIMKSRQPKGICSSGLITAVSEMIKCGVLQPDGYLLGRKEAKQAGVSAEIVSQLAEREKQHAFLLYSLEAEGKEVYLTQQDLRNVQLAKAAIQAGIQCMLQVSRTKLEEIEELVVAGVLGNSLQAEHAVCIGMLPQIPARKFCFAGNAAGRGAAMALLSEDFSGEMQKLLPKIRHVELAQYDAFQEVLLQAMNFTEWN